MDELSLIPNKLELTAMSSEENLRARCAQLEAENRRLAQQNELLQRRTARLWESESRLRSLTDGNILGVAIFDERGWVLQANAAYLHLIGLTPADAARERLHWTQWVAEDARGAWLRARAQLRETAMTLPWETEFVRTDGTRIPVLTGATLLHQPENGEPRPLGSWGETTDVESTIELGTPTVLSYALDMSAQKHVEAELVASRESMRIILESLREGLLITDLDDVVLYCNQRMAEMSGYAAEELLGKRAYEVLMAPEQWQEVIDQNSRRALGESAQYEIMQRRKDGTAWRSLISGSPMRDAEGNITGTVGAHSDITEAKAAEERARQFAERLEASNRDLQAFAYAVSHDLKEPLRKIQVFGERIEKRSATTLDEDSRDYLRRMRSAAQRMNGLIDGLLDLSRVVTRSRGFTEVDLNVTALEVLSDLEIAREQTGGEVSIGELPAIQGDAVQMRQLMQNLVANSLRYQQPDVPPQVRIEGWQTERESGFHVADNGIGFEPRDAERIFDVFMRLAPRTAETEGVGVGLTICRKIVERHGGTITAEGRPGAGATFTVRLPREGAE